MNPLTYTYNSLKCNARRRGKPFDLTFIQFSKFCIDSNYMKLKGKTKNQYSIDRIDPTKGYSIDNIQILTVSENSTKSCYNPFDNVECPF